MLRNLWRSFYQKFFMQKDLSGASLFEHRMSLQDKKFPRLYYENEEDFLQALPLVEKNTMGSYARLISLWNQVKYVDEAGIEGALIECGTWKGGSAGLMAIAHMKYNMNLQRKLHLLDSFEGLPEPDSEHDGEWASTYSNHSDKGNLESIGKCVGTLEDNQHLLRQIIKYPEELTCYHKGWFQDTLPTASQNIGKIAILRLDGDWYDSTKVCLEYLFDKVVPGGIVVIDDYGHWEGCRKAVDEFMMKKRKKYLLNYVDKTCRYLII